MTLTAENARLQVKHDELRERLNALLERELATRQERDSLRTQIPQVSAEDDLPIPGDLVLWASLPPPLEDH